MSFLRELVLDYEKKALEKAISEETVMAYLVELSQRERYDLYLHFEEESPQDLEKEFCAGMERILKGEPMAHVLGYSWFYGYKILVNRDVLIPRYETEELCANILNRMDTFFSNAEKIDIADVGTGSGAIAITLCREEEKCVMRASDISSEAVDIAKKNAQLNEATIEFLVGNMLDPLLEKGIQLDVLVCNPPYIPQAEEMESSVVDYEPHVALFGGEDGLKYYREVFMNAHRILKEKAFMAFEMGWNQREAMTKLIKEILPEDRFEFLKDINGKDRMLFVYHNL
ncbi:MULTISPECIES: peptide chain release factor N(5)-glutamine methyltransferase [Terrabacteria group]|uniref:peptide chain release factor N(5)-glutamine methyltransferase n=1 Tax=Bacillati TaxID=1783272 RepID=UPI001C6DD6A3|nr:MULTISPECIES: peptide chain release factor N(5)-glutamine methyltransferase [Terrabacteria group]MBW9212931.1 peptide chain release factor N(5)-glutamine methyltransferase [Trueperella sp. zg.1013]